MFEKILVALDGSPRAPDVLTTASAVAARFRATLYPLRVVCYPPDLSFAPTEAVTRDAEAELHALLAAHARLATLADPIVRLSTDAPWRGILQVAEELRMNMIVLGSHGYGGLDRILGTTAGRVANSAQCDVLVVHGRGR
jgi:nucleotide-binding universal stress UspA family protein